MYVSNCGSELFFFFFFMNWCFIKALINFPEFFLFIYLPQIQYKCYCKFQDLFIRAHIAGSKTQDHIEKVFFPSNYCSMFNILNIYYTQFCTISRSLFNVSKILIKKGPIVLMPKLILILKPVFGWHYDGYKMDHKIDAVLTLLRARGAASGVLDDVDSFAVSEVELSDELLLESSLVGRRVANCRMEDTRSLGSLCSSLWPSWRWRWVRSLAITCDKDIPNACGAFSETVGGRSERAAESWHGTTQSYFGIQVYKEINDTKKQGVSVPPWQVHAIHKHKDSQNTTD